jgi:putative transposase
MGYKTSSNVVYHCEYHVVWCPKYRRKVLVGAIELRLRRLIKEIANSIGVEIIKMEIIPDYVYLLVEAAPQFGIHRAVRTIKGKTSHFLRNEFPELKTKLPTLWTNWYFVSTGENVPYEEIEKFIDNQETSQRKK